MATNRLESTQYSHIYDQCTRNNPNTAVLFWLRPEDPAFWPDSFDKSEISFGPDVGESHRYLLNRFNTVLGYQQYVFLTNGEVDVETQVNYLNSVREVLGQNRDITFKNVNELLQ